jgi:predicted ester cyclase
MIEQLVRETLAIISGHDLDKAAACFSDDLAVIDPVLKLSTPMDKARFLAQLNAFFQAFPDWSYDVRATITQGDKVQVIVETSGTHSNPLHLPGLDPIPATAKRFVITDQFVFTVTDNLVSAIVIESPPDGGLAEMHRQLGLTLGEPQT